MTSYFDDAFDRLIRIQRQVSGLNPALGQSYPVAIVKKDQLLIYDFKTEDERYHFVRQIQFPMPIPKGIRAAFPLEDYDSRIACVVSPDVFDSTDGYITILHEFVHCYQFETCEQDLKMSLDIARKAQEVGDFMWEIQHPFPYHSKNFIHGYSAFLKGIERHDPAEIMKMRNELRTYLGRHDYEYMVWQEWKEGFARWIENLIKRQLGMPENMGGMEMPYSRVLFYWGGAAYISHMAQIVPAIVDDLQALFGAIYQFDQFHKRDL